MLRATLDSARQKGQKNGRPEPERAERREGNLMAAKGLGLARHNGPAQCRGSVSRVGSTRPGQRASGPAGTRGGLRCGFSQSHQKHRSLCGSQGGRGGGARDAPPASFVLSFTVLLRIGESPRRALPRPAGGWAATRGAGAARLRLRPAAGGPGGPGSSFRPVGRAPGRLCPTPRPVGRAPW